MPLTREQRTNIWALFRLIGERDMPSNCTITRLAERSGQPPEQVTWAVEILWSDGAGFIDAADPPRGRGERGYFVDPKAKKKTPMDLDALYSNWELSQEDDDTENDDEDDDDEDDEWAAMDEEDED